MPVLVLPSTSASSASSSVSGSVALPSSRRVEPVGRAFQATKHAPPKPKTREQEEEERRIAAEKAKQDGSGELQLRDAKYDRYKKFDIDLNDYYTLLGLEDKMFEATKEEITEAYRTICKVIHPDKSLPEDREKAEERYKALQVGFETLTDAARRRGYDSSLEFDDSIPKEKEGTTEKTFFSVYGPVFESNARFSNIKPVPKLGDMSTSDEDVLAFYDFWNNFSSWREFAYLNENNLETASCRAQKREFQRENEKKQASKKREELARVRRLADQAAKKDPRMQRIRREAEEAKNAAKNKKLAEQRAKEEETKRKAEEEAEMKKQAEEQAKREAENKKIFKEVMKKTRQAFGKSCKANGMDEDATDVLRANLELEQLQEIVDAFNDESKKDHGKELFDAYYASYQKSEEEKQKWSAEHRLAQKKLEEQREAEANRPWTHDEEQQLVKAVTKYPPGTVLRWEQITEMVNHVAPNRGMKDVIRKAKLMETRQLGTQHIDDHTAYQLYLNTMSKPSASPSPPPAASPSAADSSSSSAAASSSSSSSTSTGPVVFSIAEQAAFEQALKSVPKDAPDRWEQIAKKVGTKTKKECMTRFKEVRESILKGKGKGKRK